MKIEIRDGHHYVDVFPEPEPKMFDSCQYIPSVRFVEAVIEDFYSRKGMSLK